MVGRDDSIAGSHATGDLLDQTFAFGEGLATGIAALIQDANPLFADMNVCVNLQCAPLAAVLSPVRVYDASTRGFSNAEDPPETIDVEPPNVQKGYWSESTVAAVVFNLRPSPSRTHTRRSRR